MNLRKTLLATSITSLLCISYGVSAEPVTSVITLNGITKAVEFASQADADASLTTNTGLLSGLFLNKDANGNTIAPSTTIGMVTSNSSSTTNNVPVTMIRGQGVMVVAQPQADGSTSYVTLTSTTPGVSVNDVASAYLKQVTGVDTTPNPILNNAVVPGLVQTGVDAVKNAVTTLGSATVDQTVASLSGTTVGTSTNVSLAEALISQQALFNKLSADAATLTAVDPKTVKKETPVAGALAEITNNPAVQLATIQANKVAADDLVSGGGIVSNVDDSLKAAVLLAKLDAINTEVGIYKTTGDTAAATAASQEATAAITAIPTSALTAEQLAQLNAVQNSINQNLTDIGVPTTPPVAVNADLTNAKTAIAKVDTQNAVSSVKNVLKTDGMIQTADLITKASTINQSELQKAKDSANKVVSSSTSSDADKTAAKQILSQVAEAARLNTSEFFAENTPDNGIAGNPSSMMNIMVDGQFAQGSDIGLANNVTLASSSDGGIKRSFSAGVNYNYYNLAGTSVNAINLPLSYSTKFNDRNELILSVPLSYIGQSSKIDSYQIGVGVAYKFKPMNFWTITPAFNYAYRTASYSNNWLSGTALTPAQIDNYAALALGDEVSMWGGSISNKWDFAYNGIKISLTNFNGYFENFGGSLANNDTVSSYVLKNGVSFSKNMGSYNASTYFTDTEYFDSNVFFEQINEFGLAINPSSMGNLNISVGYLFSLNGGAKGDLDGFKLNLNYQF